MAEQIYAVLVALEGDTLLLPNVAVAEVVGRETVRPAEGAPPWLGGYVDWSNRRVPAIRFEVLNGSAVVAPTRRERVVVINTPGVHLPGAAIAIIAQGYPHLVTLNREAMKPQELRSSDRTDLVLSRVRIASREALIPDLESVEAEIARAADFGAVAAVLKAASA
jgi:chemosensory pili system protein ChpC